MMLLALIRKTSDILSWTSMARNCTEVADIVGIPYLAEGGKTYATKAIKEPAMVTYTTGVSVQYFHLLPVVAKGFAGFLFTSALVPLDISLALISISG